jgi:alkanesulfonate monooxygenase SsuD/methylene tetrahydromethanopterin reductase-like flavin-dependent oxidoreductase (luciferase family)
VRAGHQIGEEPLAGERVEGPGAALDTDTHLVGTPDQIVATLARYAEAGVTHVQIRPFPWGVPFEVARRTVELFGRHVVPALSATSGG